MRVGARQEAGPLLSGPITTVTTRSGTRAGIHRHGYTRPVLGGWTVHGYGWRCTGCRHTITGYTSDAYAEASRDATDHECEDSR